MKSITPMPNNADTHADTNDGDTAGRFAAFAQKMRAANLPELTIRIFHRYYQQVEAGATGCIDSATAGIVDELPTYDLLDDAHAEAGRAALSKTVVLKLNGGLGTSMGLSGPKSLLPVKEDLTFLDVIVNQVLHLRRTSNVRLPLVFMNSFNTEDATADALRRYPELTQDLPFSFLQNKSPKIWADSLEPVTWPDDPDKEWCPPGHGDIYISLVTSGLLDEMLAAGYEYLFVSNSDNLGAVLDEKILGYFAQAELPFLMEVAERTAADRKGGHLSRRPDGQLILRELSQCPPEELDQFQDIRRYRYFNTNNLWIHLPALQAILASHDGVLELPLIRNEKPVDPTHPNSPRVYQLETAMGSAIALFPGAQALCVRRRRFIPVKKTSDLLLIWSDIYQLTEDFHIEPCRPGGAVPLITLDEQYYGLIDDLQKRFPHGAPSLCEATAFTVEGDITFGKDVRVVGDVHLAGGETPQFIPDGTVLTGDGR